MASAESAASTKLERTCFELRAQVRGLERKNADLEARLAAAQEREAELDGTRAELNAALAASDEHRSAAAQVGDELKQERKRCHALDCRITDLVAELYAARTKADAWDRARELLRGPFLEAAERWMERPDGAAAAPTSSPLRDNRYTRWCAYYPLGRCIQGDRCTFAHTPEQKRPYCPPWCHNGPGCQKDGCRFRHDSD